MENIKFEDHYFKIVDKNNKNNRIKLITNKYERIYKNLIIDITRDFILRSRFFFFFKFIYNNHQKFKYK